MWRLFQMNPGSRALPYSHVVFTCQTSGGFDMARRHEQRAGLDYTFLVVSEQIIPRRRQGLALIVRSQ
jgi:hypothetical protein